MKEKNTLLKNYSLIKLLVLLLLPASVIVSSCNNEGGSHDGGAPTEFKPNCVMLSKAQVQAWVDSGWTKPGSQGQIKDLVFQFFSGKAGSINSNLQLLCYPGESLLNVKDNGKTILAIDTTCKIKPFSGDVILGNNILSLSKLNIFNADGSLKKFDFIRFTPEQLYPPYINFKVEVIIDGLPDAGGGSGGTLPCPTFCG